MHVINKHTEQTDDTERKREQIQLFCLTNTSAPKPSAPYIDSILTETEPHKWEIRKHFCVLNTIRFQEFENLVF